MTGHQTDPGPDVGVNRLPDAGPRLHQSPSTRSSGGNVTGCAATFAAITGSYGSSNTTDSFVGKCRKNVICDTPAAREIAATVVASYPSRRNNSNAHRCNAARVRSVRLLTT